MLAITTSTCLRPRAATPGSGARTSGCARSSRRRSRDDARLAAVPGHAGHDETLGITMLHAGLPPQWDLETARHCARELEQALRGDRSGALFEQMYGNEPDLWSDELEGTDRLRSITNALTRLRACDADGRMLLKFRVRWPSCRRRRAWFVPPDDARLAHESSAGAGPRSAIATKRACSCSTPAVSGAAHSPPSGSTPASPPVQVRARSCSGLRRRLIRSPVARAPAPRSRARWRRLDGVPEQAMSSATIRAERHEDLVAHLIDQVAIARLQQSELAVAEVNAPRRAGNSAVASVGRDLAAGLGREFAMVAFSQVPPGPPASQPAASLR